MEKMNRHILLIGFMGTGKSIVGIELARALKLPFIDTDEYIVQQEKMTISLIFKEKGEKYFRQLEEKYFYDIISHEQPSVISTGGGIILSENNRSLLEKQCVILLTATAEEIWNRIRDDSNRPLLNKEGKESLSIIKELLVQRSDHYLAMAKLVIHTNHKSIHEIKEEIIPQLSTCIRRANLGDNNNK